MPICWTDAQGVLNTTGPLQAIGTTGPMTLMGLGSSFDLDLANVWGQTEGTESREYMVTGLFGPQTDLDRQPNWGRNLTTTGEDPYLSRRMVAAQIHGIQGVGTMSEMKHFAVYNGQNQNANTDVQDQALHEQYLTPYEGGFLDARAAATMCSYQLFRDTSTHLPDTVSSLTQPSPFGSLAPPTWKLNESHYACEQPLLENYILRDLWHSKAFIGSDYPATHSTSAILQGEDQEMPTQQGFFSDTKSLTASQQTDPTGSTCADAAGNATSCSTPGAVHVGGIPGPGCPAYGCALVDAVMNGTIPLAVFNQALARILYQEERFGMLGCEQTPRLAMCTNPGGIGSDRTGATQIPNGPTSGTPQLGTKNGDAAVVERYSEEGAVLLKNQGGVLPLRRSDLNAGILVTGPGANHTIADPTNEASLGFPDRDAVNPLLQLKDISGRPAAFTYAPANDPTGYTVPPTALSQSGTNPPPTATTGGLSRTSGPGSPSVDRTLDFTTASNGQLAPGSYTWSGYVYVPTSDTYTFDFQSSASLPTTAVTVTFDGNPRTLTKAPNVWPGTNQAANSVPGSPTTAGFTEGGLYNQQFSAGTLPGGTYHAITISFNNTLSGPASFRFGYTRTQGDIDDAAAAARGKRMAIVFLNDGGATTTTSNPYGSGPATISAPESLNSANTNLIQAVAAANPNTVVVLNTTNPVLMPWRDSVSAVLEMWFAGQEGGTSTARLLLGLANPSGHTSLSWPAHATDTLWAYNQPFGLYPGDTPGPHLERLNYDYGAGPSPSCVNRAAPGTNSTICTNETEGIFTGYRYVDRMGIQPAFPFGYGLSYTRFRFSHLRIAPRRRRADVSFRVTNIGSRAGTEVAQVYVGRGPDVPGVQQAVRALRGFERVRLRPGQTKRVTIRLDRRSFQYWDERSQSWQTNWGRRTIFVGDADALANLPLSGQLRLSPRGTRHAGQWHHRRHRARTVIRRG